MSLRDRLRGRRRPPPDVVFVTREGCGTCARTEPVVRRVAARHGAAYEVRDVDADPALHEAYTHKVPVVLLGGVEHAHWDVDERALDRALRDARRSRSDGL